MAQIAADTEQASSAASSLANPAPLGLFGFALTTFVLSAANAGLFTGATVVVGLAAFYGGLAQLLAGMWEFRNGNTFGAAAFSTYGAFWLSFAALLQWNLIPANSHYALAYYLIGWTIITGVLFLGTLRSNIALMLVFITLFLTYLALVIGAFGASSFTIIGGWLGIITALVAWYTGLAGLLSSSKSAFTLPVGPLG